MFVLCTVCFFMQRFIMFADEVRIGALIKLELYGVCLIEAAID